MRACEQVNEWVWCLYVSLHPFCPYRGCGVLEHMWFRVELTVDPAPSDYTHCIRGHVFSTSVSDLIIDNPFNNTLKLQVSYLSFIVIIHESILKGSSFHAKARDQ